jgi:hypothetical protein
MPKAFTKIKLDKERTLRFTVKSLLELEEHFGRPYHQFKPEEWTLKDLAFILACGLKHEDPEMNLDKAAELMDEAEDLGYVFEKLAEAYTSAFVGKKGAKSQDT